MKNFDSKRFRYDFELTQADLAEIIGLTQSNVSRLEVNGVSLSKSQVDKLNEKFSETVVNKYMTEVAPERQELKQSTNGNSDLISVINSQNLIIERLSDSLLEISRRNLELYEKLMFLIEKNS